LPDIQKEQIMSYVRKNSKHVVGSILGVLIVAAIAMWQFYLFATFENNAGQTGQGTSHLWWAIGLAIMASGAAFLVFSVFLRHDADDDLHITSTPRASHSS
jgi:Kef-type K+ transport system membrane component KefB